MPRDDEPVRGSVELKSEPDAVQLALLAELREIKFELQALRELTQRWDGDGLPAVRSGE